MDNNRRRTGAGFVALTEAAHLGPLNNISSWLPPPVTVLMLSCCAEKICTSQYYACLVVWLKLFVCNIAVVSLWAFVSLLLLFIYKRVNSFSRTSLSTPGLRTLRSWVSRRLCRKGEKITPKTVLLWGQAENLRHRLRRLIPQICSSLKSVIVPVHSTCS